MFAGEDDSPPTLIVEDIVVKSNEKRKDPKDEYLGQENGTVKMGDICIDIQISLVSGNMCIAIN